MVQYTHVCALTVHCTVHHLYMLTDTVHATLRHAIQKRVLLMEGVVYGLGGEGEQHAPKMFIAPSIK